MARFRIKKRDAIKAHLYNNKGVLLTSFYNSGFTSLAQVKAELLSKCCNPPRVTKFSVYAEDSDTYWSNL